MKQTQLFRRVIGLSLVPMMLLSLAACGQKPSPAANPVTAEQAITQLKEQAESMGFENALSELEEKNSTQVGGDSYIRLQQYYEGIPVYGRTIVYGADEQGNLNSLTGNVQDVDEDIDLVPSVEPEAVQSTIDQFFTETYGEEYAPGTVAIEPNEEDLCIYVDKETSVVHLAYHLNLNGYKLVIDAHDGMLLHSDCMMRSNTRVDVMGQGVLYENLWVSLEDGYYYLTDSSRRIRTYEAPHASKVLDLVNYIDNEMQKYEIAWQDGEAPPTSAVDAYFNTMVAHDYFAEVLGNIGPDGNGMGDIRIITGIEYIYDDNGEISGRFLDNAMTNTERDKYVTYIVFGEGTAKGFFDFSPFSKSAYIDVVAHEYTHAVEEYHSSMIYAGESGAIMEGLSDLYGELVEGWATKQAPNWVHGVTGITRNLRDPGSGNYPTSPDDPNRTDEDYVHAYSTVISHSAYLMWNGIDGTQSKKLSETELAELWYRAMLMMPSDCDFTLCRQLVEIAAQSMETLDDAQRACVREAFDRVGIPSTREEIFEADYHLNRDAVLTVYDRNKELYSGYTLQINGNIDLSEIAANMTPDVGWVVNRSVTVDEAGAYELDLPQGYYALTVSDRYYDETYTFYVEIKDDHTETNIDLITEYEEPLFVVITSTDYENLVTDAYSDVIRDRRFDCCYHIPQIDLDADPIQSINEKIYSDCYSILERDAYEMYDEYGDLDLGRMTYAWGVKDNLLSVVVEMVYEIPCYWTAYNVYTVSLKTGEEVGTDALLEAFDLTEDSYYDLVRSTIRKYLDERKDNIIFIDGESGFRIHEKHLLAEENVKNAIPYINADNELSIVLASEGYVLLNTVGDVQAESIECTADHNADQPDTPHDALRYFIENCDSIVFEEADIQDFDKDMCRYARNGIFARSGRKFNSQDLQEYYSQFDWYEPRIEPDKFRDDMLNRIQRTNLELIQKQEQILTRVVNISEEEAHRIAYDYWNYSPNDTSGDERRLIYEGMVETPDGKQHYAFRLKWRVYDSDGSYHVSTIDQVYINAETGECIYPW